MSLVAWIPPADLAERALGPEAGGGRPSVNSVMQADEHGAACGRPVRVLVDGRPLACPCGRPWHYMGGSGGWCHINSAIERALLLSLDGTPCALSIWRGRALLGVGEPLFGERSPRDLAEILVARLGGEIVEVTT